MSNLTAATLRSFSSAWEVMEQEYDSVMFDAARAGLFEQDIEADCEVRARKGKYSHKSNFTNLTPEQLEQAWMYNMASRGRQAWDANGDVIEVIEVEVSEFLKLTDKKGRKILFHHFNEDGNRTASRRLRQAWKWADVIVCCHSAALPSQYRHKAALLKGGAVCGELAIVPAYNY